MVGSFSGNRGRAGHIFVRGVSARTDEGNFQFGGPAILHDLVLEFGDRSCKIWCEGSIDMWLQFRQILQGGLASNSGASWRQPYNIDNLVVFSAFIRTQVVSETLSIFGNIRTFSRIQIVRHAFIEWEE